MEFRLIRAAAQDVKALAHIMDTVTAGMNNPEWFMDDDAEYIAAHIGHVPLQSEDEGFIIKAVADIDGREVLAGFFMAAFPGPVEKNLGNHIGMSTEGLCTVAHMDSVVILPEFRGYGLQSKLVAKAEEILLKETPYRVWMCTVHPDNKYSLNNMLNRGYEVVAEALKYGGYRRYILKKEMLQWQNS